MQILLRSWIERGVLQAVSEDSVLGKLADADGYITMNADSAEFETYLHTCNRVGKGIRFWPRMVIEKSELNEVERFELISSGLVLRESDAVSHYNLRYLESLPRRETAAGASILIISKAFKKAICFPAGSIYALSDWANEYVISARVKQLFQRAGLAGFECKPMFSLDERQIPDYFLLYIDSILPPTVRDKTVVISGIVPKYHHFSRLGYLCYDLDHIIEQLDFNRTAEPFSTNGAASIVVSRRVKECVEVNKLKGLRFRPVLSKHTPLYESYLSLWDDVFSLLGRHNIIPSWYA